MVAIPIPPCDGDALKARLFDEFNIEVPITDLNGLQFVRVSIAAYNTQADVEALVGALKKIFGKG
jgi:isopenicillin-N epimerase